MKIESVSDRRVQFAFGAAILTSLVAGAMSYRGIGVSHCAVLRRLDV